MTHQLRLRDRAIEDIASAHQWYQERSPQAAERFEDAVGDVLNKLAESPASYPSVHRNVRRALTRHFPYVVYFLADKERITVLRVLHHARNPREWSR